MKIGIVDTNYPKQEHQGLAATWLRWELDQAVARGAAVELVEPQGAEVLLLTTSSPEGVAMVRRAIKEHWNETAVRILGGGGCTSPPVFDDLVEAICVGEGAHFVRTLFNDGLDAALALPETWIPGDDRRVVPNLDFPWELPPLRHPDGTIRVFGSRGCKNRCLFCQTGWASTYRVNPRPKILQAQVDKLHRDGHRIAVITNDGAEAGVHLEGQQSFVSAMFTHLKRMMPISRKRFRSVRIGVEGVSERIRRAVHKPVGNEELLRMTWDLLVAGVGVRWFFVTGLPAETLDDYLELQHVLHQLRKLPKGVVMMNFHAYIPCPATPLCIPPLDDTYFERYDELIKDWFFSGPGFTRHVQLVGPAKYPTRLKKARESMAASAAELRRGWWNHDPKSWRIEFPGHPDNLRRLAARYLKRMGAPYPPGILKDASDGDE